VIDVTGQWDNPSWQALTFAISDPHYYSYEYTSDGTGTNAQFTARANGNLDGDGTLSTFERAGRRPRSSSNVCQMIVGGMRI